MSFSCDSFTNGRRYRPCCPLYHLADRYLINIIGWASVYFTISSPRVFYRVCLDSRRTCEVTRPSSLVTSWALIGLPRFWLKCAKTNVVWRTEIHGRAKVTSVNLRVLRSFFEAWRRCLLGKTAKSVRGVSWLIIFVNEYFIKDSTTASNLTSSYNTFVRCCIFQLKAIKFDYTVNRAERKLPKIGGD